MNIHARMMELDDQFKDDGAMNHPTEYRGFLITPVFNYSGSLSGKTDFEYHKIDNEEVGGRVFRGTIEQVQKEINEKLNEL